MRQWYKINGTKTQDLSPPYHVLVGSAGGLLNRYDIHL